MNNGFWDALGAPFGPVFFVVDSAGRLTQLSFGQTPQRATHDPSRCAHVRDQLQEYFAGDRTTFDLELDPAGTRFQQRVWRSLTDIPYGEVCGYGDIARRIGKPGAARAVGQANGANPIPIVIPCHRVISSDGSIGGYTGGLQIKQTLLALEGRRQAA